MTLQHIDWVIIIIFFAVSLLIGVAISRRAGKSTSEFFLSGRDMPWWLLGISMVATTFSADTPNLVTNIVRTSGVAGNWLWWSMLLTGMMTVFIYAKLWRRSGVMTDIEFYELRYSGKAAAFLRGFRALYLGIFFNMMIMALVTLAAIKICGVILGLSPWQTIAVAGVITVTYSTLGGLRGVVLTDFIQFAMAMVGAIFAAWYAMNLPQVGGLSGLLNHANLQGKLSILPDFSDSRLAIGVFIFPILVQWWNTWYPGAEPGGGGYIAQRMLSAKNEKHAIGATLLFNVAHYALRPWPWIIVALCSMVVFPDLDALRRQFPNVSDNFMRDDLAYPAMMTFLPAGWLGLVVASLIAAYMSTISTHLNWGSSYIVNDFYKRFVVPQASEKQLVFVGRLSTVFLMVVSSMFALLLQDSLEGFQLLLLVGAGTGLIFILRWFWWRINAFSEVTAMIVSFIVAVGIKIAPRWGLPELEDWQALSIVIVVTTVCWVAVTLLTRPTRTETLREFYRIVQPGGPGWRRVVEDARAQGQTIDSGEGWDMPYALLCMAFGCGAVYGTLFATGYWIYGNTGPAWATTAMAVVSTGLVLVFWRKMRTH